MQQSAIEELDGCDYLYLEAISEPHANGICLLLSEGIVSDRTETLTIGDAQIPNVRPVEVTDASRWFEVVWDTYISYSVRNESFCSWDKSEEWSGNAFRPYERSKSLFTKSPFILTIGDRLCTGASSMSYPSDVSDAEWNEIQDYFKPDHPGRPRHYEMRAIYNAIR